MEGKHPKRKRDKYNPYFIYEKEGQAYIEFQDGQGESRKFEISRELYEAFNKFELEDVKYLNEVSRHFDYTELTERFLSSLDFAQEKSVEEIVLWKFQKKRLHKAMDKLSKKQQKRLILHYFYDLTYGQIAEQEECSVQAVAKSISSAEKKLKKFLKKG